MFFRRRKADSPEAETPSTVEPTVVAEVLLEELVVEIVETVACDNPRAFSLTASANASAGVADRAWQWPSDPDVRPLAMVLIVADACRMLSVAAPQPGLPPAW